MKVYISVDIEGLPGVTNWNATELGHNEFPRAAEEMTMEAVAACEGALDAGADEIYVKDAHDSGRNMDLSKFPEQVRFIQDWMFTPDSMVAGIDSSFDALILIGYHCPAGMKGNPLNHTMNLENNYVKINGQLASEYLMHAYLAAERGVPTVFVSGDAALCGHVKEYCPGTETLALKEGRGRATINLVPSAARHLTREGVCKALKNKDACRLPVPDTLTLEIGFKEHFRALRGSFYPGVERINDFTVRYKARSMEELMTARMFIL